MKNLNVFNVKPNLPANIQFLEELCNNVAWCWTPEAVDLFVNGIDSCTWHASGHNPKEFLSMLPQQRFEDLSTDKLFLSRLNNIHKQFKSLSPTNKALTDTSKGCIAYFSLEFGLHESIRIYSGGLGLLAGDHLKSATDLKLPLVGVGLLYNYGYFKQVVDSNGYQQEIYFSNSNEFLPINEEVDKDGNTLIIEIPIANRSVHAKVWRIDVGCAPLYLMDTNIPQNPHDLRNITSSLYGGDEDMRLTQEILLGVGGFRALVAIGYEPTVCHLNEGHAAFVSVERTAHLMRTFNLTFDEASILHYRTTVFTTHTPVPAGNERFDAWRVRKYIDGLFEQTKIPSDSVITRGHAPNEPNDAPVSMTILGLSSAFYVNGVSKLHAKVAQGMWQHFWPNLPKDEVPIAAITNGVHAMSWISSHHYALFNKHLGYGWQNNTHTNTIWKNNFDKIPEGELWNVHEKCRTILINSLRRRIKNKLLLDSVPSHVISDVQKLLSTETLTIGFARRFATYKRASLLLQDKERFLKILTNKAHPVQFIFAGKAHPADVAGKNIIREIIEFAKENNVEDRLLFVENYDISIARVLVQGVDVWLNNPVRPEEASGTSGMKAAMNGALNLSIPDGWWDEAYHPGNGWCIDVAHNNNASPEYRDFVEGQNLYSLLENRVVPLFYDRGTEGIPHRWVTMMKNSIKMSLGQFSSHRMVSDYNKNFYKPATAEFTRLTNDNCTNLKYKLEAREHVYQMFPKCHIEKTIITTKTHEDILMVGSSLNVTSHVFLGELDPDTVLVQAYYGSMDKEGNIESSSYSIMALKDNLGDGNYTFTTNIKLGVAGKFGVTSRLVPNVENWAAIYPGFVSWSE